MIWLIGAGQMAVEYAKVLLAQRHLFICITRSESSAIKFEQMTNHSAISGGLEAFLHSKPECPASVIIATGIENLSSTTDMLLEYGVKSILVEKPAGLYVDDIKHTFGLMQQHKAQIYVAYNRRFFETVKTARKMIADDGGITSLNYEITEWANVIESVDIDENIKKYWFIANTSHVVDLAFHLGGRPKQLSCFTANKVDWHPNSANFAGAGVTGSGALFSYHGNWNAPGRWSLDIMTAKRRYIFKPMEQLHIQQLGSIAIEALDIDYRYDDKFKPGLYLQTCAFLSGDNKALCHLEEHQLNMNHYVTMANYKTHTTIL